MKKFFLLLSLVIAFSLTGCSNEPENPKLADDPDHFYKAWDEAAFANLDLDEVKSHLASEYPDELNLETHSGLIDPETFTGPIICFAGDNDYRFHYIYIPDQSTEEYLSNPMVPEDAEIIEYTHSAKRIPDEYLSDEKLTALQKKELPIVFAMVESTGYESSETFYYPSGETEEVYWPSWRVSFYSYPDCKLLGWESAARPYSRPEAMSLSGAVRDANYNRVHLNDDTGRIVDVLDESWRLLYGESN